MSFSISRIRALNFVLYRELDLKFEELEDNLVFITGENLDVNGSDSNGCGKSLIGDLITDLLFDKTIRKHSQKSLIGKFGKSSFTAMVIKDNNSDDSFVIVKHRNSPTHKDKVFFRKYNSRGCDHLSKKTKADTYKLIWKTFGINWRTFKNRNYYGQGDSDRFLRVTDARKAEIIVDIQGLEDLDKSKDKAHKLLKKAKEYKIALEVEISNEEFMLKSIKESMRIAEKDHAKTVAKKVEFLKDIGEEIGTIKKELSVSKKCVERLKIVSRKIDKLKEENEEFILLGRGIESNKSFLSSARNKMKDITERKNRLTSKISDAKKEVNDIKNKVATLCDKCGANLTDKRRIKAVRGTRVKIKEDASTIKSLNKSIEELEDYIINIKKIIKGMRVKSDGLSEIVERIAELEATANKYMPIASQFKLYVKNLSKAQKQRKSLKLELEELHEKKLIKHFEQEYNEVMERRFVSRKVLKKVKWSIKKNEITKAIFDKSIRTMFVSFLNNLNHFSNIFLDTLSDGNIDVRFSPLSEKLSKKIVDEISVKVSVAGAESRHFNTYSGGEKGRIEVATQLALFSSADSPFPFLFFDEPFIGIDEDGRSRVIDLFKEKADKGNLVIIISHDNIVSGYGTTLNIKRKNGRSWIDA